MKKSETTLRLGDVVRDRISGFKGVVVCRSDWLNGCVRLTLQPQHLDGKKAAENQTFDVEQLELVKAGAFAMSSPSGGPMPDPAQRASPRR